MSRRYLPLMDPRASIQREKVSDFRLKSLLFLPFDFDQHFEIGRDLNGLPVQFRRELGKKFLVREHFDGFDPPEGQKRDKKDKNVAHRPGNPRYQDVIGIESGRFTIVKIEVV